MLIMNKGLDQLTCAQLTNANSTFKECKHNMHCMEAVSMILSQVILCSKKSPAYKLYNKFVDLAVL